MAGSRNERIGSIFSRVTSLLRCGALHRDNKPLWYDVYQVFPPKIEPSLGTRRKNVEIRDIFYPEDTIRAKFHKKIRKNLPADDLRDETTSDITRRAIEQTYSIMRHQEYLTEDDAVNKVVEELKKEGAIKFARTLTTLSRNDSSIQELNANTAPAPDHKKEYILNMPDEDELDVKRTYVEDFEKAIKNVSGKDVNVAKNLPDDEK